MAIPSIEREYFKKVLMEIDGITVFEDEIIEELIDEVGGILSNIFCKLGKITLALVRQYITLKGSDVNFDEYSEIILNIYKREWKNYKKTPILDSLPYILPSPYQLNKITTNNWEWYKDNYVHREFYEVPDEIVIDMYLKYITERMTSVIESSPNKEWKYTQVLNFFDEQLSKCRKPF